MFHTLFILDAPGICIKGKEQIICGDTAEFKAEVQRAESFSFPIKWQRRRGQFVEIIDTTLEKYSGSTDTRLVIPSVCKEDTWGYQASLSAGNNHTLYSNTINLHVLGGILLVLVRYILVLKNPHTKSISK